MDRLTQIDRILDSCLTTEIINQVYPSQIRGEEKSLPEPYIKDRHRSVQIHLLELIGSKVEQNLKETLKGKDLVYVSRRVEKFLEKNGFTVKPIL
jgi:hypothetical protein